MFRMASTVVAVVGSVGHTRVASTHLNLHVKQRVRLVVLAISARDPGDLRIFGEFEI